MQRIRTAIKARVDAGKPSPAAGNPLATRFQTLRRYWRLLAHYLQPESLRMALLGLILCFTIAAQLAAPLVASHFIDDATSSAAMRQLLWLALLTLALALAGQGAAVLETWVAEHVSWVATNALRA